jgi:selenophosphate synthetase-related protein
MLLETSGVGAVLDLERVPAPPEAEPLRWLTAFPSFGYVLAVEPAAVRQVCARFDAVGVACAAVGEVTAARRLMLHHAGQEAVYLDLAASALTGFGA